MSAFYNKSDKKSTKISKLFLHCVPEPDLQSQLLSTGKTKLQCKTSKLVRAGLLKIILDSNTCHSNLPLFEFHDKFQQRFGKRGVIIPELPEALRYYEELLSVDTVVLAFQAASTDVTSTPKVKARVKSSLIPLEPQCCVQ